MKEDVVDIDKFIKTVNDRIEDKRKQVIEAVNRAYVISEDMVEKIIDILVEGNKRGVKTLKDTVKTTKTLKTTIKQRRTTSLDGTATIG